MSDSAVRNRRRNILSQPRAQMRIITFFAFLSLVYACLNFYISKQAVRSLSEDMLTLPLSYEARYDAMLLLDNHTASLDLQLALFTLISFAMLCLAGLLLSHRIGGPITNLRSYLRAYVNRGSAARRIRFRRDDFFHDLADAFNVFQVKAGVMTEQDESGSEES